MVAAAEGPANGTKYIGGRVGYAAGPVNVAVALGNTEVTAARDFKAMNVGASFNAGFMTVMGQYHRDTVDNQTGADVKQTKTVLGVLVPVGAGTIKASYGRTAADGTAFDATQAAVGYVHDLSKRTALYTHFSKISNGSGANYVIAGNPTLAAVPNTKPRSTGYEFGVRHSF